MDSDHTKRRDELALEYAEKLHKKVEQWPDKNAILLTNWPGVWSVGYDKGYQDGLAQTMDRTDREYHSAMAKLIKARAALENARNHAGWATAQAELELAHNCAHKAVEVINEALEKIG